MRICPLSMADDPVCLEIWDAYNFAKEMGCFPISGCQEHPAFVEGVKIIMGEIGKKQRKDIKNLDYGKKKLRSSGRSKR